MKLGTLNKIVKVIRYVEVGTDHYNNPLYDDAEVHRFWAALIHKSENEAYAAAQQYAKGVVTFRTHWWSGLEETDKLECEGRTYNVRGQREIGDRAGMEITAEWQA